MWHLALACVKCFWQTTLRLWHSSISDSNREFLVYSLRHGVLNLQMPPTSMWMNLGYWADQVENPENFPKACEALLRRVLQSVFPKKRYDSIPRSAEALLTSKDQASTVNLSAFLAQSTPLAPRICLFDVGIGCDDQTVYL